MTRSLPHILTIAFLTATCWQSSAGQSARSYASSDSVTVGDRFQLILVVDHDPAVRPIFPGTPGSMLRSIERFGELDVLGIASTGSRPLQDGSIADSILYDVTTFGLDTVMVPSLPIRMATQADSATIFTASFELPIYSVLDEGREDVLDLMPIVEFPAPTWPWVLGIALAVALTVGVYILLKRRQTIVLNAIDGRVPPTPIEEARASLQRLSQYDLGPHSDVKPFFVELSDTLRTYLGRRLHVSALESTTLELVSELEELDLDHLADSVPSDTSVLLLDADLVKFADEHRSPEACHEALERSSALIESIESDLTAGLEEGEELEITGGRADHHEEEPGSEEDEQPAVVDVDNPDDEPADADDSDDDRPDPATVSREEEPYVRDAKPDAGRPEEAREDSDDAQPSTRLATSRETDSDESQYAPGAMKPRR